MSFKKKQGSTDQNEQAARSTVDRSTATESAAEQSVPDPAQMGQVWPSIERAEEHFGMRIPDESTLQRLEDHERAYGRETHDWIAEGMPADIMGSPKSMEAFRQRQAERPPEVPTNIERQNRNSVFRSEKAATETDPAGETGVPNPVRDVISSRGRSLDSSIQRAMEDRMGDSFGDVRIHTGSTAAEACESINARAFTVGNHIAFNSGEYDPESPEGQHVLAHELAHVRQQTEGAVSMLPQDDVDLEVDPDPALEREAEETAQRVMEGGELGIQRLADTEIYVQRLEPNVLHYAGELLADKENRDALVNATKITAEQKVDDTKSVVDQKTTQEYRLTQSELEALIQTVDEPAELQEYLDDNEIEPTSEFEETVESEVRWSIEVGTATYSAATLLSIGFTPAAIAALASGYGMKKVLERYGDELSERARELIREQLEQSTDSSDDETGETENVAGSSRNNEGDQ